MDAKKVIAIFQSGGRFETERDGSLSYSGGDARAIEIDDQMKFNDLKMEVAEMFNCNINTMALKYFIPGNRKILITVSSDKDLQRMVYFHGDSITADVYLLMEQIVPPDVFNTPGSRSSRTSLSEELPPFDVDDDTNHIDPDVDLSPEVLSVLPISVIPSEDHPIGGQQWENTITGVGQRFSDVREFRETLRKFAMERKFAFRFKKNESHRVTVECKAEGCPWRIHASKLSTTKLISIKTMNPTHTCDGIASTSG